MSLNKRYDHPNDQVHHEEYPSIKLELPPNEDEEVLNGKSNF